jgi:hypothetical protein
MRSQLTTAAAFLVLILIGLHGADELINRYSTGQLWANFRGRGQPNNYRLITYGDDPFNFVSMLIVNAMFVLMGCLACIVFIRKIRVVLSKGRSGG